MLARRALPSGRCNALGVTRNFPHGTLDSAHRLVGDALKEESISGVNLAFLPTEKPSLRMIITPARKVTSPGSTMEKAGSAVTLFVAAREPRTALLWRKGAGH
jgi:hypothetical protein